jgi:hypothetical protein
MLLGASPRGCKRALERRVFYKGRLQSPGCANPPRRLGVGPSLGGLEWVLVGVPAEARQLTGISRDGDRYWKAFLSTMPCLNRS